MDFTQEDLIDAVDRLLAGLLERAGVEEPPVDCLGIAADHLGIPVDYAEPEEDERGRPVRGRTKRPAGGGIVLAHDMTDEQQQEAAALGIARSLIDDVLRKIGVPPGSENKALATHVRSLLVHRLLVPTRLLRAELRACGFDVLALKERFRTATVEVVAQRLLDLDDPCVIAIADDGVVALRKGNRFPATRKLTAAEQACLDRVMKFDRPERVRQDEWTVHGWPVPDRPFRRVILRGVPDDL